MWIYLTALGLILSVSAESFKQENRDPISTWLKGWATAHGDKEVRRILNVDCPERRKLIDGLNKKLRVWGYPAIEGYTDLTMRKSCIIGIIHDPECFGGLDIVDKKNRFCLPCIVPHNQVHWWIQDKSLPLPDINGPILQNRSNKVDGEAGATK